MMGMQGMPGIDMMQGGFMPNMMGKLFISSSVLYLS
jgi:hypothetical protein